MPLTPEQAIEVVHAKERKALKALMRIYGDDVSTILNGLHQLSARLAIASGVEPEAYAAGMKYHWDNLVNAFNEQARKLQH